MTSSAARPNCPRCAARRRKAPALLAAASLALASGAAAADEPRAPERAGAGEAPAAQRALVLIVAGRPGSPLEAHAAALVAAHVRPSGVGLHVVRRAPAPALDVGERVAAARALVEQWSAQGALWIEAGPGNELALYLFPRGGERVYSRRFPAPPGRTSAAVEALANVAGSAAEEVLEGPITGAGMASLEVGGAAQAAPPPTPSAPPDAPAPPAAPPSRPPAQAPPPTPSAAAPDERPAPPPSMLDHADAAWWRRWFLSAGYAGGTFGAHVPWQSAVSLSLSWTPTPDSYVGAGYDWMDTQHLQVQRAGFDLDLDRTPLFASGGHRFDIGSGRWAFHLGGRATFDVVSRSGAWRAPHALWRSPGPPGASSPEGPPRAFDERVTDLLISVAPTTGLSLRISDELRISLWTSLDVPLNRLSTPALQVADLQPDPVRFLGGIGLELGPARRSAPPRTVAGR
ncbi:hypothetical protein [Sorangium atrum]|uniref:Secreted protein n=1 Tax=Sorangium atrum TaxID=2995308 RepID=A0ABT5C8V8_9BACT|nr:hypothetical protein [Sorangium aterium]MDC0682876.1 hypothetical protein [Sorangium aterium]